MKFSVGDTVRHKLFGDTIRGFIMDESKHFKGCYQTDFSKKSVLIEKKGEYIVYEGKKLCIVRMLLIEKYYEI